MGDRELPYRLLKRVMATCTAADYGQISLAVMRVGGDGKSAAPEQSVQKTAALVDGTRS